MTRALLIALAALASTPASAEWWRLTTKGCLTGTDFPSPASIFDAAQKAGWSPAIVDNGKDGVDVQFLLHGTTPFAFSYFRTAEDCQASIEHNKHALDGYR